MIVCLSYRTRQDTETRHESETPTDSPTAVQPVYKRRDHLRRFSVGMGWGRDSERCITVASSLSTYRMGKNTSEASLADTPSKWRTFPSSLASYLLNCSAPTDRATVCGGCRADVLAGHGRADLRHVQGWSSWRIINLSVESHENHTIATSADHIR